MRQWQKDTLSDSETIAEELTDNPSEDTLDSGSHYVGGIVRDGLDKFGYYVSRIGDYVLIASFYYKSETVGRNDPKIEEHQNNYVEAKYYWVEDFDWSQEPAETLQKAREQTKDKHPDQKGWMNGYRLKSLERAIEEMEYPGD
jgi:hypothetical protein